MSSAPPRRIAAALLVIISAVCGAAEVSAAHPMEVVPVRHWAYGALRQLAAAGMIPSYRLAAQPLTRGEIAALVRQARAAAGPPAVLDLLDALKAEFLGAEGAGREGGGTAWRAGFTAGADAGGGPAPRLTLHPLLIPEQRLTIGGAASEERWVVGADLAAGTRGGAPVAGVLSGGGTGPEGNATLLVRRAYASGQVGTIRLAAGRDLVWWGVGERSTVFLDAAAGGLDALRLSSEWPNFRLTKLISVLSTAEARYLIGTRADWQVNPRLRVGLVDLVVARPGGLLPYWILNPVPVVINGPLATRLQDWAGANDNPLGGIEFDYLIRPGVQLYGQGLADDIITRGNAPHRIGGQVGILFIDPFRNGRTSVRLEYTAVTNWTYTVMNGTGNHYLFDGRPLGFWLGNDGDDLYVELSHVLGPSGTVRGWLSRTRHGEGRVGAAWPSQSAAFDAVWLSGVAETRYAVGVAYETRRGDGWTRWWVEVGRGSNVANVAGVTVWDARAGVEVAYGW